MAENAHYTSAALTEEIVRLRKAIRDALNELGEPQPGYPAPVTNAVKILKAATKG